MLKRFHNKTNKSTLIKQLFAGTGFYFHLTMKVRFFVFITFKIIHVIYILRIGYLQNEQLRSMNNTHIDIYHYFDILLRLSILDHHECDTLCTTRLKTIKSAIRACTIVYIHLHTKCVPMTAEGSPHKTFLRSPPTYLMYVLIIIWVCRRSYNIRWQYRCVMYNSVAN